MSVGGRLLEIKSHVLLDADDPKFRRDVLRLWVIDRSNFETIVYAEPVESGAPLPHHAEEIWWGSGKIYFDGDKKHLVKVGYSTGAPTDDR
jgi:hypothetical protein